jgi:hypothetical protein
MSEQQKEDARAWIRRHPESDAYKSICAVPPERRHESMRDLPYAPAR